MLKRQKPGAITLATDLNADGVEVDIGGLDNRPRFENQLLNDTVRNQFFQTANERKVEIIFLTMTGYMHSPFTAEFIFYSVTIIRY